MPTSNKKIELFCENHRLAVSVVTGVLASYLVQHKGGIPDRCVRNVTLEAVN